MRNQVQVLTFSDKGGYVRSFARPTNEQNATHQMCCICSEMVSFNGSDVKGDIVNVAHGNCDTSEWSHRFPKPTESEMAAAQLTKAKKVKSDKPKNCPICGGPSTRGLGFSHAENCEQSKQKLRSERPVCPDCGGPAAKRRGWTHNENCPRLKPKAKRNIEPSAGCPVCGGGKRGRGYSHIPGCSAKPVIKPVQNSTTAKFCPDCGGSRLGRGYRHTENCSSRQSDVVTTIENQISTDVTIEA